MKNGTKPDFRILIRKSDLPKVIRDLSLYYKYKLGLSGREAKARAKRELEAVGFVFWSAVDAGRYEPIGNLETVDMCLALPL